MPRNLLFIILLIVVVFASLQLIESPPKQFQSSPEPEAGKPVLIGYLNAVKTTQYNQQGLRDHHFEAARVNHRATILEEEYQQQSAELASPDVTIFEHGQRQWHLRAKRGESQSDNAIIFLQDDVIAEQFSTPQMESTSDTWTIKTNSLAIDTQTKDAYTEDRVELTSANIRGTGTGMKANLGKGDIHVLADTKTYYETAQ